MRVLATLALIAMAVSSVSAGTVHVFQGTANCNTALTTAPFTVGTCAAVGSTGAWAKVTACPGSATGSVYQNQADCTNDANPTALSTTDANTCVSLATFGVSVKVNCVDAAPSSSGSDAAPSSSAHQGAASSSAAAGSSAHNGGNQTQSSSARNGAPSSSASVAGSSGVNAASTVAASAVLVAALAVAARA